MDTTVALSVAGFVAAGAIGGAALAHLFKGRDFVVSGGLAGSVVVGLGGALFLYGGPVLSMLSLIAVGVIILWGVWQYFVG